jgi:hypothetical protein
MNVKRSSCLWVIAAVVTAAAAAAFTAGAQVAPKPEKICPITFILEPATSLQQRFARDTEEANATLAQNLVLLRGPMTVPELAQKCAADFEGTYLAWPTLWDESGSPVPPAGFPGKSYQRWEEILGYLKAVVLTKHQATYLAPQSARVYLEYLPLANQAADYLHAKRVNLKGFPPEDVDFLAAIRTVLAYAPYDDPLLIGNENPIPHRKVCDPIY